MKAVVFGSLNIDKDYTMPRLPEKGETLYCTGYEIHVGGKGLNQALSLRKAGAEVIMAGRIGEDGAFLKEYLEKNGVSTELIDTTAPCTGHCIIEVDPEGHNQMILFPGGNKEITEDYCDKILTGISDCDIILLQYETSCVEYMLRKAKEKEITTAINPSPYVEELKNLPFDCIDYIILNEDEGKALTGKERPEDVCRELINLSGGKIILTLGGDGAVYADRDEFIRVPAFRVNAVDTTGAGDTFTGYALFSLLSGEEPVKALRTASAASAVAVTKKGAAETIPEREEVMEFLLSHGE